MTKLQVPSFSLSTGLTAEQKQFFHKNGAIIFRNFIDRDTVKLFLSEIHRLEQDWLQQGLEKVNGIPLKFGKDENGNKMIQRLCFTSQYSEPLHKFVEDPRLRLLLELVEPYEGRIGETEKD